MQLAAKSAYEPVAGHQVGAYSGVCSMNKRLEVFLLLPERDASPLEGYQQHYVSRYPSLNLGGERPLRATCLAKEQITISSTMRTKTKHSYLYLMYISLFF